LSEQSEGLIIGFLCDKGFFWKEITNRRGGQVEVDIDLADRYQIGVTRCKSYVKNTYEDNFNNCNKSQVSINLENRMHEVVDRYAMLIKCYVN
jgi:hypothetical protein